MNQRLKEFTVREGTIADLDNRPLPYDGDDLQQLAQHCTVEEDAANNVERQAEKSARAMLLQQRISEQFEAVVTGTSEKGTWVRLLNLSIEGRLS